MERRRLPYPGLRSFRREETDLFFGRENCINDMVDRIGRTRFLAVLGSSGSGKSSLVKTGLIDALELGLLTSAGSRWQVVELHPGSQPLRNLAAALLGNGKTDEQVELTRAFLTRGPKSIVEWCRDGHLAPGFNLLLLVDQFEELFRYCDYAGREEAEAFVGLLIESAKSAAAPIYVTLTMRSEYLGACPLFDGLAEFLNEGQFLTPRMAREECRIAIVDPARVCGLKLEDALVNQLLNDVTDFAPWDERDSGDQLNRLARRADQLPLLQHALNRLWMRADRGSTAMTVLKLEDYRKIGGLRGAIDNHAHEILEELGRPLRPVVESVFRALTMGTGLADAVRRPTKFIDLVKICGGDVDAVRKVVDAFRAPGRNFLVPETSIDLAEDPVMDISHEALIRQWRQLTSWLEEEARAAQQWQRLKDAAATYRRGESGLLQGRTLDTLVAWRERTKPNPAWAALYGGGYEDALGFLDESVRVHKSQRLQMRTAVVAAVLALAAFGWWVANEQLRVRVQKQEQQVRTEENHMLRAADEKLKDVVHRTLTYSLSSIASKAQDLQREGKWETVWNLLGTFVGEVLPKASGNPDKVDPPLLDAVRARLVEQMIVGERLISTRISDSRGRTLTPLSTGSGRFGLLAAGVSYDSFIYLFDKDTGAILRQATLPNDSVPDPRSVHFVSDDGRDAIVLSTKNQVYHWSLIDGKITEQKFDLVEANRGIRSIALERATGRIALLLGPEKGANASITVSDSTDGAVPRLITVPQFDSRQRGQEVKPDVDREEDSDAASERLSTDGDNPQFRLLAFVSGAIIAEFRPGSDAGNDANASAAGLYVVDVTSGQLHPLLSSSRYRGSALTPDERFIIGLSNAPDRLCDTNGGAFTIKGTPHDRGPADCLFAIDLRSNEKSLIGVVLGGGELGEVQVLASESSRATKYSLLLRRSDFVQAVDIEVADDGRVRMLDEDGAAAESPFTIESGTVSVRVSSESSGTSSVQFPLMAGEPIALGESDGFPLAVKARGDGLIAVTVGSPNSGNPELSIARIESGNALRTKNVERRRLPLKADHFATLSEPSAAFDDDKHLLLFARGVANDVPAGKASDATLLAAWLDVDQLEHLSSKWNPVEINSWCRREQSKATQLTGLRYWGLQVERREGNRESRAPAFIATDSDNRLWLAVLRSTPQSKDRDSAAPSPIWDPGPTQVEMRCVRAMPKEVNILATDPREGYAAIRSDRTYIMSLGQASGADSTGGDPPAIPLVEPVQDAKFVAEHRLALGLGNGDVAIAAPVMGKWVEIARSKAALSEIKYLEADQEELLVVSGGGGAVVLGGFDRDTPYRVAVGKIARNGYGVFSHLGPNHLRTVDVIDEEQMLTRYRIPLSPRDDEVTGTVLARGVAVEEADRRSIDVLKGLLSDDSGKDGDPGVLSTTSAEGHCQLALDAFLEKQEEKIFEGDDSGDDQVELAQHVARTCSAAGVPSTEQVVARAILSKAEGDSGWPPAWSGLIQAAETGESYALRAFALAVASVGDDRYAEIYKEIGEALYRGLNARAVFLSSVTVEYIARGGEIPGESWRAIKAQADGPQPNIHRALGHLYERSVHDQRSLAVALREFWIAEKLFRESGRGREADKAALRRAMLARALPMADVEKMYGEVLNWRPRPDVGSPAGSLRELPGTDAPRLDGDLAALEAVVAKLGDPVPVRLLRAVWIGSTAPDDDPKVAIQRYRSAIDQLGPPMTRWRSELAPILLQWAEKLQAVGDRDGTATAIVKALMLFEWEPKEPMFRGADLDMYASLIDRACQFVSTNPDIGGSAPFRNLSFSTLSGFSSTWHPSNKLRSTLVEKRRLLRLLMDRWPDRSDWGLTLGLTEYWLGVTSRWKAVTSSKPRTKEESNLKSAVAHLKAVFSKEPSNMDARYLLANAQEALADTVLNMGENQRAVELYEEVERHWEILIKSLEDSTWSPPGVEPGFLLSKYANNLDKLSTYPQFLYFPRDDLWNPEQPETLQMLFNSLRYAARQELARRKALGEERTTGAQIGPGYTVALLSGHFHAANTKSSAKKINPCDRYASSYVDPLRGSSSILQSKIDVEHGTAACEAALKSHPGNSHFEFLLARVLQQKTQNQKTQTMDDRVIDLNVDAARQGYAAAFNNISYIIEQLPAFKNGGSNDPLHRLNASLRHGYAQRVLIVGFANSYAFLEAHAGDDPKSVEGLRWLLKRAARLGVAEAHTALANLASDPPERRLHLEIAAKCLLKLGRAQDYAVIRARAQEINLPPGELERIEKERQAWEPEALSVIPTDLAKQLRAAF